jgi:dTDP-4-dehydrorhamnose reductase
MKILITGANGQLGKTFKDTATCFKNYDITFADRSVLDVTNLDQVTQYIADNQFNFVINAAAYTDVDGAEANQKLAWKINYGGALNLAFAVKDTSTKLIQISTDYVFSGIFTNQPPTPYVEGQHPSPLNYYGETKRAGEAPVLRSKNGIVIRTSWLYSFCGKNFVRSIVSLAQKKKELSIVSDQIGCPTSAWSLSDAIFRILPKLDEKINWDTEINQLGNGERIFHYTDNGIASWYDFACAILRFYRLDHIEREIKCKILPISTENYPTPAKRSRYSVLSTKKFQETFGIVPRHWQDELRGVLETDVKKLIYAEMG